MTIVIMQEQDISTWNSRDFVRYYLRKHKEFSKTEDIVFSDSVWLQYGLHIKRFLNKHKITPQKYRAFIDFLFDVEFLGDNRNVSFLAIVSINLFFDYCRIKNSGFSQQEIDNFKHKVQKSTRVFPTNENL